MNKKSKGKYNMYILEIQTKENDDPVKEQVRIKKGLITDYNYGMKKAKIILHPVDLEGIIKINEGDYLCEYKIRISYSVNDIFDIDKYIEYMSKKEIIQVDGKTKYVTKKEFKEELISDLNYTSSIEDIYNYLNMEIGVSAEIYTKLLYKEMSEKLEELNKKSDEIYTKIKESEKIIKLLKNINIPTTDINVISEKSTGISFDEISLLSEYEFEKYIDKISEDIASAYLNVSDEKDVLVGRIIKKIIKKALLRAKENTFSNNLFDYLIINSKYNEINEIVNEESKKLVSQLLYN